MNAITKTFFASVMSVGVAAAFMPATASAQGANQGWYKTCTKQEDNDVCIVQNIVTAPTGQLLTAVGLIKVTGKVNRMILQVTVPTARMIQPGINMQVDGGQAQRLEYAICMPETCVAETLLTDAMVASFKKGGELVLTSVNYQRTPNPLKISLEGFTQGWDGEPVAQSELQERQRLLQEEMAKKADEARKKLEDAQAAAKKN
ncbi:invasion associated locus B family protein [Hoeflea alexandrii]|uniref:invasion associated locus B family protein n=1 Tax=Hoeflea alexandrii TaxID=288436 RepID=UPI0022AE5F18|nr:invasion associated locus B family protein [Hoeflea alexandrii]MCZ4287411.1 invasion associated locus B family protein [Hoeflea alexandrii]